MSVSTNRNGSLDLQHGTGIVTQSSDQRWQPARAGLVNVWRYWDETFSFHKGRLLLLGANGSGKSLGLELLLPFLLDANASPSRLTSAAKARGGLYDRMMAGYSGNARAGFLWVEFVCADEYFTVGARLRASQSTRKVDTDFFTTTQRIGITLHLVNEQREPLTTKLLKEALAEHGTVHNTAKEHRQTVRRHLFKGFSEDRYDALIAALLAMRKEKLSQHLDLHKMSDTLSDALTPLEEHDLAAVAEGFERLDRRRKELESLEAELKVIKRLARHRKKYAQHVCVRIGTEVRHAESERDAVTRRQREATSKHEEASAELQATQKQLDTHELTRRETEARLEALQASEAYKNGAQLSDLQNAAERLEHTSEREEKEHRRFQQRVQGSEADFKRCTKTCEGLSESCEQSLFAVRSQAQVVGADKAFDTHPLDQTDTESTDIDAPTDTIARQRDTDSVEHSAGLIAAWVESREREIGLVRTALTQVGNSTAERDRQRVDVEQEEASLEKDRSELDAAEKKHEREQQQFVADTHTWVSECVSLNADQLKAALPKEITVTDMQAAMLLFQRDTSAEIAVQQNELQRKLNDIDLQAGELESEKTQLQNKTLQHPEAPTWRDPRDLNGGCALWSVLEPKPELEGNAVDCLEAALTASGFLDAWLAHDGKLHLPKDKADVILQSTKPCDRSLADVLLPSVNHSSNISTANVNGVLQSIAVRDTAINVTDCDVVIGLDGTFKLGAATGRGRVQPASFIGASARERRRLERLQVIDTELQQLDARRTALKTDQDQLLRLIQAITDEFDSRPDGKAVESTAEDVRVYQRVVSNAEARVEKLRSRLQQAEAALRECMRNLSMLAVQHKLPSDEAGLEDVKEQVSQLALLADEWRDRRKELADATSKLQIAQQQLEQANRDAERATARLIEASEQAAEARARFQTLNAAVGQDFKQLLAQSSELKQQREALRVNIGDGNKQLQRLTGLLGELSLTLTQTETDRQQAEHRRSQCHERFRQLVVDRISIDAEIDIDIKSDAMTAVLNAARLLSQELPDVKTDSHTIDGLKARQQEALHQAHSQLGGHIDLDEHQSNNGWWILVANSDGTRLSILELCTVLTEQLSAGRDELAADEEALFERTLAGSIRQSLASRIRQTSQLVDQINHQLETVRTAAGGVAVKLRWHVDEQQADAVQKARQLLLKDPGGLTADERSSLQEFVRARVEQARLDLEANAPWQDRLRESLDYRVWHRFSLQVAHRDWEGFKPATEKLMSKLSTGERSVVLHLPMLASIAAHYSTTKANGSTTANDTSDAQSDCPRLILLDELFAGVDKPNRRQLFGTFSAWQLDAVFTSDHEWCDYDTLNGIAIHVLHPSTGDEPVTTTRFYWDGKARYNDDVQPVH